MSRSEETRKILFIVSNDHGELSTALDFAAGQPFDARLLIPDRLDRVNRETLPIPCRAYRSLGDILAAVTTQSPDVVFLLSGYLYAINGLLSLDDMRQLVGTLRAATTLVTSDPFMGRLFQLDHSTFSEHHPARGQLVEHFARLVRILAGTTHLYRVAPPPDAPAGSISFYNPHTVLEEAVWTAWKTRAINLPGVLGKFDRWLFVLSAEDYAVGVARWGKGPFDEILGSKLRETTKASRQPVLIAPAGCLEALRQHPSTPSNALLVEFCDQETFLSLLYEAEFSFYWNLFSHSIIARVMNRRPVFFFDWGHLVHAVPSFFQVALVHFYGDAIPRRLDEYAPLSADQLAEWALEDDRRLTQARTNFAQSPPPAQMVERLFDTTRS